MGRRATADELAALDERGFCVVPALLSDAEVKTLNTEFERLVAEDPESRRYELGTRRAKGDNDNDVFAVCWRHRVVLDAAMHTLGSTFEVGRVDFRDPSPSHGEQRHHPDHGPTPVPGITATWYLDALRDARLFHAGGRNTSGGPRRSAFVFYQHDIPDGVSRSA